MKTAKPILWPGLFNRSVSPAMLDRPPEKLNSPGFRAARSRGRLLIVDNDSANCAATATRLQSVGYEVVTAAGASQALTAVAQCPPDVVLLDIDFPPEANQGNVASWDGLRLLAWLRGFAKTSATRFIAMTGADAAGAAQRSLDGGAFAFFPKPIDFPRLLALLERELSRHHAPALA